MALWFRNVVASPQDDVPTWPCEALVTAIDRGLVGDWRPVFDEIRRALWGSVAGASSDTSPIESPMG